MMGEYPGSKNDYAGKATTYGPLPDHGFTAVALVYHTTETRGMPGFNNGDTAPHYVYDPRDRTWWVWAEYGAGYVGTLKGHSSGHYNCQAYQVEILAYSDQAAAASVGGLWVGDFTDDHYTDLAAFYAWAMDRYAIGAAVTPTPDGGWLYGTSSAYRMSDTEWNAFTGLTAHGAVPKNTHWDTGVLELELIHDLAGVAPIPPPVDPPPTEGEYVMQTIREGDGFIAGDNPDARAAVKAAQIMLDYHGFADLRTADGVCKADGAFGPGTKDAVVAFQNSEGLAADGVVGPDTWEKLDA